MTVTVDRSPLHAALAIPGARAVALLNVADGATVLWRAGDRPPGGREAAMAVTLAVAAAGLVAFADPDDELGDVLVASGAAFHVLRLVGGGAQVAHLTLRRDGANLAMARQEFKQLTEAYDASPDVVPPALGPSSIDLPSAGLEPAGPLPAAPASVPPALVSVSPQDLGSSGSGSSGSGSSGSGPSSSGPSGSAPPGAGPPDFGPAVPGPAEWGSPGAAGSPGPTGSEPPRSQPPRSQPPGVQPARPEPSRQGPRATLPRRRPNGAPVAAGVPPPAGDPGEAAPAWLTMLGQPYLTDEHVLDRILLTLRDL